ncbi:alpha/beta fold hydrolase [Corallococcus macrosporus]|uniref:Alpha/beta fold hydrolase n=1 Tax=Corallococcus macrosporus TaxID=35 RepID=A0ABS3DJ11_9BACT|nr:type I polyketide synthase [Corallococcus macrosporus]MBN8231299.1 alpha/beta fold hydrolase [Corallococcus macrosporus]
MDDANASEATAPEPSMAVAVVGLALRFPGAADAREFWRNLAGGVDSITRLDDAGRAKAGMPQGDEWVVAAGVLEAAESFDAAFFGYSPREAEGMDPQQRAFLECAWSALESAGHAPRGKPQRVAVFAGGGYSLYGLRDPDVGAGLAVGVSLDFLATRVSYELDLKGPAMTVQTGCSTALVALHLATQSLLAGECDMAIAGGVSIRLPQLAPYRFQEGDIVSPDGWCRPFDVKAGGTVASNGVAAVVLKRLDDAVADRDPIRAVVLGTALNNDGSGKTGFTAPSVDGQVAVIADAQAVAGVAPGDVSYIEAHGTATALGDPIEVAALRQVFQGVAPGVCGLGSVKSNVGHLGAVAGLVGVIKTVLALEHRQLPPTLNFTAPHPLLELEGSPFHVVSRLRPWEGPLPLRAGVSSLGIGGTNAHVVLQEAPRVEADKARRREELLLVSAKTEGALERMTLALVERLREQAGSAGGDPREAIPEALADVAHTLQVGRARFPWRRFVVVGRGPDAASLLSGEASPARTVFDEGEGRGVAFLFPGGGAQRVNMGESFLREPAFRAALDTCAELLRGPMGADLREVLFAGPDRQEAAARELDRPLWSQPALFACDWALAQLWLSWGVKPAALLGHSLGEYVAACLAGVFTLEEALGLVVARGRLMEAMPPGGMVSVLAPVSRVEALLGTGVSVAAVNGPQTCVLSGPLPTLEAVEAALTKEGVEFKRVRYARAAHSAMMEPFLEGFAREVAKVKLRAPTLPVVSSLTGRWLQEREATSPEYWVRHLRHTVRFSDALECLLESGDRALIEVGPGTTLTSLARQHPARKTQPVLATLPTKDGVTVSSLEALGEAWAAGVDVDWERFRDGEKRRRVDLPTYSFDRVYYSLEEAPAVAQPRASREPRPAPRAAEARRSASRVAPRDATERDLVECFQQLFRVEEVGIRDDFFALGGDSLLALRLLAMVSERFGKRLALREMLTAPTVELLAKKLGGTEEKGTQLPPGVVPLQQGTRGPPVFFVHAAGGHSVFYRQLAQSLGEGRPVYAFESRGLDPDGPVHTSVEEMATAYLEGLRALQPQGPYLLAGASFGGAVIYEMARRLTAEGHAVPLCAMFDSPGPADIVKALEKGGGTGLENAAPFMDPEQERRFLRVWDANIQALLRYPMPPFEGGTIQFFRAATVVEPLPEHLGLEWLKTGAVVRVETVPGDHNSMLTGENAAALGAKLAALIP